MEKFVDFQLLHTCIYCTFQRSIIKICIQFRTHSCFAITVTLYFYVISPGEGGRGPAYVLALSVSTGTADCRPGVLQGLLVMSSRFKGHRG